jgi:hypothetical protein
MRIVSRAFLALPLLLIATASPASELIEAQCDPVTDGDSAGCLFSGNIGGSPNPDNPNSYKWAELEYNIWAASEGLPTITLNLLTDTDDGNFSKFGTFDGEGETNGVFALSDLPAGFSLGYYAVKAGPRFTLFEYLGTDGTGSWSIGGQQGMSHIAFFGNEVSAVPEASTWAMMLIGFGMVGFSMRTRRRPTRFLRPGPDPATPTPNSTARRLGRCARSG